MVVVAVGPPSPRTVRSCGRGCVIAAAVAAAVGVAAVVMVVFGGSDCSRHRSSTPSAAVASDFFAYSDPLSPIHISHPTCRRRY